MDEPVKKSTTVRDLIIIGILILVGIVVTAVVIPAMNRKPDMHQKAVQEEVERLKALDQDYQNSTPEEKQEAGERLERIRKENEYH